VGPPSKDSPRHRPIRSWKAEKGPVLRNAIRWLDALLPRDCRAASTSSVPSPPPRFQRFFSFVDGLSPHRQNCHPQGTEEYRLPLPCCFLLPPPLGRAGYTRCKAAFFFSPAQLSLLETILFDGELTATRAKKGGPPGPAFFFSVF